MKTERSYGAVVYKLADNKILYLIEHMVLGHISLPKGHIEKGETEEECAIREIKEELDTVIQVNDLIETVEYDYPAFHLSMDCFWCEIIEGNLNLLEAEDSRWLTKDRLYDVDWLPADRGLIEKIKESM